MRRPIYIPDEVRADIAVRVTEAVAETLIEFESAEEDEDVVTGHLGARMTTRSRLVFVEKGEPGGHWSWSLKYRKFRGRGPGASEKALGADGIFELLLERSGRSELKSLLFQSKMAGSGGRDLVEQCARLSTWREAAVVLTYGPDAITAISIDSALKSRGAPDKAAGTPLDRFINDSFVPCEVGDNDLRYVPKLRQLSWRTIYHETVAVRFSLRHRFQIAVRPPIGAFEAPHVDRHIEQNQIHNHRMEVDDDALLRLQDQTIPLSPKKTHRALSKIYHPDLFGQFSPETREHMDARLKEFNGVYEKKVAEEKNQRARNTQPASPDTGPKGNPKYTRRSHNIDAEE